MFIYRLYNISEYFEKIKVRIFDVYCMYAITTVAYYRLPLKAIITYRPTKDDVSSGIILFDHVLI